MATLAAPVQRTFSERRFYTGMALLMLAIVLVGFSRSFFLRPLFPAHPSPTETVFYLHGAVFAAWMVLLAIQASLIARRSISLHRRIGAFSAALAVAVVALGIHASLVAADRPTGFVGIPIPPLQFLAIPLFDVGLFAAFVLLAFALRGDAQSHKRWMLLATVNLITAAIARIPGVLSFGPPLFFGLTDLFIVAIALWDFSTRGRLHPATLWGGLVIIASQPLRLFVSGTEGWLVFARWATGLLG